MYGCHMAQKDHCHSFFIKEQREVFKRIGEK